VDLIDVAVGRSGPATIQIALAGGEAGHYVGVGLQAKCVADALAVLDERIQVVHEQLIDAVPNLVGVDAVFGFVESNRVGDDIRQALLELLDVGPHSICGSFLAASAELDHGNPDQPDVAVDIYDMGNGIQAFGLFTDEAGDNQEDMGAGTMGFKTDQGLGFIKGPYYVKISRSNDRVPMERFAEAIDGNIGATFDPFALFSQLPDLGQVAGTRYIKEAYRGLDFANNVIEREYRIQGKRVQVALFTQNADEISRLVTAFREFFEGSDTPYDMIEKGGLTLYQIQDPYEGDWVLLPRPDTLLGLFGSFDDGLVEKLLADSGGQPGS